MSLIDWRKEFETGVAEVDHEHKELVRLLNELDRQVNADSTNEQVTAFLGEVFAKIASHFALEETVMRKHKYDEYAAHKADHEKLLDDIRDIMDNFEQGQFADYRTSLSGAVRDWFVNHFKTKDARLHRLLGV